MPETRKRGHPSNRVGCMVGGKFIDVKESQEVYIGLLIKRGGL